MPNRNAIYLSIEAMLALLLLSALIAMQPMPKEQNLDELYIFQLENDLLKLWARQGMPGIEEMRRDFEFVFQGRNGEIKIDGIPAIVFSEGSAGKTRISSEAYVLDSMLQLHKVELTVFH